MARRSSNVALIAAIVIASLFEISMAQTTHVVGGSLNWVVPQGGASVYANWSSNQNFTVGDILVFNYGSPHDVAKVSKADFDGCSTSSPISLTSTSPTRITLNASGDHYFLCTIPGHCLGGQKLAVNVSSAAASPTPRSSPSPAPQPRTGSPVSVPAPAPQTSSPSPVPAPSQAPASSAGTPASAPSSDAPTPSTASTPTSNASPPAPTNGATSPTSPGGTVPSSNSPPPSNQEAPPPPNSAASIGVPAVYASMALFVAMFY